MRRNIIDARSFEQVAHSDDRRTMILGLKRNRHE
jgi:hypothetical protein